MELHEVRRAAVDAGFYDERNHDRYINRFKRVLMSKAVEGFGRVNISDMMDYERELVAENVLADDELRLYYSDHTFNHDVDHAIYGFIYELIREGFAESFQDDDYRFIFVSDFLMDRDPERASELRLMPYSEYLNTDEWHSKRMSALARDHNECQVCGSSTRLHIHHKTYERRGIEKLSDLITLCSVCHASVHDLKVVK